MGRGKGNSGVPPSAHRPAVAVDCEMVGCGRVSVCDERGNIIVDTFVKPRFPVADYRTRWSGLTKEIIDQRGITREAARNLVREATRGKLVVGHSLDNDLRALDLDVPPSMRRDTQTYEPLRLGIPGVSVHPNVEVGRVPSLKDLTYKHFGETIQQGSHDTREDARAAMRLYNAVKDRWNAQYEAYEY